MSEKKGGSAKKQNIVPVKPSRKTESTMTPYRTYELRQEFDRALDRLRKDFEDILWPSERIFERRFPMMREFETRMPSVYLEDRGKTTPLKSEETKAQVMTRRSKATLGRNVLRNHSTEE